jgi:hypothetical protein
MTNWESGAFVMDDARVAPVEFRPPRIRREVQIVRAGGGIERVEGLKEGEGQYRLKGSPGAAFSDGTVLTLRWNDSEMTVRIKAGIFDLQEGTFDAMSEWVTVDTSRPSPTTNGE